MKTYTAVIFCHGIGSPRHYLTTANFIDAIDAQGNLENPSEIGFLREFNNEIEVIDPEISSFRTYVSFTRFQKIKKKERPIKKYRVYEAYWADDHHSISSLGYTVLWLLKIVWFLLKSSLSSWRSYPALKMRALWRMEVDKNFRKIEKLYDEFKNAEGRRLYPKGRFKDFQSFIYDRNSTQTAEKLTELARKWRSELRRGVWIGIGRGLIITGLLTSILAAFYTLFLYFSVSLADKVSIRDWSTIGVAHLLATLATIVLVLTGWVMVRRLVSDVIAWTTTHESQRNFLVRERRVRIAQETLRNVLYDPDCARCVLIGHSLGSAIILEAFMRQNSICRASNIDPKDRDLATLAVSKVSHIFTVGSPIEKIATMFYADSGQYHRYHKIKHTNPNRLDKPAWSSEASPRVINFWSRYDLVSSAIQSLQAPPDAKWKGVENIEVGSDGAPFPLATHSGYFKDSSVVSVIFQAIASGKVQDSRLVTAAFQSEIKGFVKVGLVIFFVLASIWMIAGLYQGVQSGWQQLSVLTPLIISVVLIYAVIRKDYLRHRRASKSN